ncbi:galactolipase DONGLE, chloroplastic-like [Asparagus officinalis]|uniref:galactolipase DONGLE, chloroplastic-like n=1 Tax=Asparagus officinalis TaxID=4686 RepID=UPI00098E1FE6|nr:galactolipase DONGLE, chloroplastic-like [Asparagus officinalis]
MASRITTPNPSPINNRSPHSRLSHPPAAATALICPGTAVSTKKPLVATPTVASKPVLAKKWRDIQGADDWEDLVAPLNPLLRQEIVRYGEFVIASYEAFDLDPSSKRYLNRKYGKSTMFQETGMADCGYRITKYVYATPDIDIPSQLGTCRSHWIGYVAVSDDDEVKKLGRRDIVVSFRGTVTHTEWIANFMSSLTPARLDPNESRPNLKVESGFLSLYTSDDSNCKFSHGSCREQLLSEISRLLNKYKDEEISITLAGHSMGSSLALLLGYDLAELGLNRVGLNRTIPVTVYSYGGPRVGNLGFKERCEELGVKVLRVVNVNDPVTKLPGVFLNEKFRVLAERFELPWSCACYAHVGVELALDFFKMKNPACVHDIGTYVGLLKCPKMKKVKKDGVNLINKAREFVGQQNFGAWPWQDAAIQVGNLVQTLRI